MDKNAGAETYQDAGADPCRLPANLSLETDNAAAQYAMPIPIQNSGVIGSISYLLKGVLPYEHVRVNLSQPHSRITKASTG